MLIRNCSRVLTMQGAGLGALDHVSVRVRDEHIVEIGADLKAGPDEAVIEGEGALLLPGLVDCHTHAVWAGSRSHEFEQRLAGADYSAILEAGGGILSTVRSTREASEAELAEVGAARLRLLAEQGVTTVEIKSGYGLSVEAEAKLLRAARRAGELAGVAVRTTFLGAHTVPADFRQRRDAYVRQVIDEQLPVCAPLADAIDVYVDRGAFTVEEGREILTAGRDLGLQVRIHAEQVAYTGAAAMAAELGALSADHLERVDAQGIEAMARAGTVAVLLPGAMVYLRDPAPPVEALRAAGVPMAVATDLNPGTSPVPDLWAAATLASVTMRLTVEEVLRGITCNAARALGLEDRGRIAPGLRADLVMVETPPGEPVSEAGLVQFLGGRKVRHIWLAGRLR